MNRCRLLSVVLAVAVAACLTRAGGPASNTLSLDEQSLKQAGVGIDGPALLEYFHKRTPSEAEQTKLRQRAGQLGSTVFALRIQATDELIRAGRSALPALRDTAKKSDTETARRASYCIGVIEQNTRAGIAATASRVLAERKPAGAVEALLAYLPFVDDAWIEDEIRHSMKRLAYADGKALTVIEQALTDKEAKRRAAAVWLVGQSSDPRQRQLVASRLDDESPDVRFLAASALLNARDAAAVPALIGLLTTNSPELACRAEDLLLRVAAGAGPGVWLNAADNSHSQRVRNAWELWWKYHETKVDWKTVRLDEEALGLTLIVENQRPDGGSRIYEINAAGQIRFQVKIRNPIDAQWLPDGRLLVGDSRDSLIYEMDTLGHIGWKHSGVAPTSLQRLPNGNTVVSTYQSILEITREGKTVFAYKTQGHTYHARKLPDGHYIWIDACGEIGELDEKGTLLAKVKLGNSLAWGSIERLRNGRYLVALGGVGKVQEVDMTGKVYWEKTVANPNRAVRLANGHTLVASHADATVYEFDPHGNERWKHACAGRPFAAIRR